MDLTPYLKLMMDKNGECLALKIGSPPILRVSDQDLPVGKNILDAKLIKHIAFTLITDDQKKNLILKKSLSTSYSTANGNIFKLDITVEAAGLMILITPNSEETDEIIEDDDGFLDLGLGSNEAETEQVKQKTSSEFDSIEILGKEPDGVLDIIPYLEKVVELKGSDLFLTAHSPIKAKVSGQQIPLDKYLLTPELTQSAAHNIMNETQIKEFEATKDLDFAIDMPSGSARFRVNAFYQRGTVGLVLRYIPSEIPNAKDLKLPEILLDMVMSKRGLLLMVGGTGSGKSTTLAAIINHRNSNSGGHILTIEDPVEFSHPNIKSIINQREVGVDTASYARALKACLREAPDVILIGEIRDRETMAAALELANTGHLCISTLHANNANQAMERIVNMFPHIEHKQLFMDLSVNLRGVVSQRLISNTDGSLCAAIEVMINTPHIANLILKGELAEIKDAMNKSGSSGMKTFDDALFDLYKAGTISLETALKNADSRNDLEAKMNFG